MKITAEMLAAKLLRIAKKNAPVRVVKDKNPKRPRKRAGRQERHEYVFAVSRQSQKERYLRH